MTLASGMAFTMRTARFMLPVLVVTMHLAGAAFRHYRPAVSFGRGSGGADNVNSRPG